MPVSAVIKNKKAVFFDLFHTLASLEPAVGKGQSTSAFLGIDKEVWLQCLLNQPERRLKGLIRDPLEIVKDIAWKADPSLSEDLLIRATENRIGQFHKALSGIPRSVAVVLADLKMQGKKIGLISNADALEASGWVDSPIKDLFDVTIFSCDVGMAKPDREIFDYALAKIGVSASSSVFVGDGGSDELSGARAAGMTSVMITTHIAKWRPSQIVACRNQADYIIETLEELTGSCDE